MPWCAKWVNGSFNIRMRCGSGRVGHRCEWVVRTWDRLWCFVVVRWCLVPRLWHFIREFCVLYWCRLRAAALRGAGCRAARRATATSSP
eukprot:3876525-Prymnesium_polylepis.1